MDVPWRKLDIGLQARPSDKELLCQRQYTVTYRMNAIGTVVNVEKAGTVSEHDNGEWLEADASFPVYLCLSDSYSSSTASTMVHSFLTNYRVRY